ncbi:MAG: hypothetical protein PHE68_01915 [Candidatus Peribacteraceae bacterium]|nr:hypothetical protein [Candidatus Peribacteraceae bacterium]MDD5075171.1 hypothetical protein [Candidatus Peribacteraceae bacterium]
MPPSLQDLQGLHPQLFVPKQFGSAKERRQWLKDGVFQEGSQKHAREKPKIPLMNGGMGVDISCAEFILKMRELGLIGVWSAAVPGWKEILEKSFKGMGPTERQQFHVESDERAIAAAADSFGEGGAWVNVMRKIGNYKKNVQALLKSDRFDVFIVGAGLAEDFPELMARPENRDKYYIPIISDPRVARIYHKAYVERRPGSRPPSAWYFEDARVAGGHLGTTKEGMSTAEICDGIWKATPNIPIIMGGSRGYLDQIMEAYDQANGCALSTRLALSKQSGFSRRLIKKVFLNPDFPVVINDRSPTGYPASGVDNGLPMLTLAQQRAALMECISCVKDDPMKPDDCHLLEGYRKTDARIRAMQKEDETNGQRAGWTHEDYYRFLVDTGDIEPNQNYCIQKELLRTRNDKEMEARGEDEEGWDPHSYLAFSGKQLETIRHDAIFRDEQGKPRVPDLEEQVVFALTHNAPQAA